MDVPEKLRHGIELTRAGDWEAAHAIAQSLEGDVAADWLHAILHKIEGDRANSRYWYRKANRCFSTYTDAMQELDALNSVVEKL